MKRCELIENPWLRSLCALSSDIVIFLNSEGIVISFNKTAEKILHWENILILSQSFGSLLLNSSLAPFPIKHYKKCLLNNDHVFTHPAPFDDDTNISWNIKKIAINHSEGYLIIGNIKHCNEYFFKNSTMQHQLERIASCVPGNFYWKNKNAEYVGCNKTLLDTLGLKSIHDLIGKTDSDLWPDQAMELKKNDELVMQSSEPLFLEETVTLPGKDTMFFTVIKMPLLDDNGKVIGILGNSLEITELKKIQQELSIAKEKAEIANQAKTEFIANMSHDIRTPLAGVIGVSDILEKLEANPELKQYAHDIHDCGQKLLEMLNSILDVVSADHVTEHDKIIGPFDLRECIEEIVQLERPTITLKELELIVRIDSDIPPILANDKSKIYRIILNLFGNAVKFTNKGSITLSSQLLSINKNEAKIRLAVSDTGIGIAPEQQAKVFDRFFRGNPSYKGQYAGYGVGLHIAQSYAKLLGSEIKLVSKENEGTTFYVDLLFSIISEAKSTPPINQQTNCKIDVGPLTCLLVEDNLVALKILEAIITRANVRYHSKMDGESALEVATSQAFDFIITDIGLPGISGNVFAKQYREWEKQQSKAPIPIIALTAHAQNEIQNECIQSGVNEVFSKPFSEEMLNHIISKYLQNTKHQHRPIQRASEGNGKLGRDLPDTEKQLFELEHLPLLNAEKALTYVGGNKTLLTELLTTMANQVIPAEIIKFETAYQANDWDTIERLAHKMKGGAVYVGTEKLKFATQYLERYRKAGHTQALRALYEQMMAVIKQTSATLLKYLEQK